MLLLAFKGWGKTGTGTGTGTGTIGCKILVPIATQAKSMANEFTPTPILSTHGVECYTAYTEL